MAVEIVPNVTFDVRPPHGTRDASNNRIFNLHGCGPEVQKGPCWGALQSVSAKCRTYGLVPRWGELSGAEEAEFTFYLEVGIRPAVHGENGLARPG